VYRSLGHNMPPAVSLAISSALPFPHPAISASYYFRLLPFPAPCHFRALLA
jgi:hypothetical protein